MHKLDIFYCIPVFRWQTGTVWNLHSCHWP